jgi:hypothetical protein
MDTPTPDADSVTPETGRVITMVPEHVLDQVIAESAIVSINKVSEGLFLAFENLEADGYELNQIQKTDIMSSIMYCLRDIDRELQGAAAFSKAIHESMYGETKIPVPSSVLDEFKDMFEFDPSEEQ